MESKIVLTSDGSHSLYIEELDEHYHSYHGAIQEAKHVFIKSGLNPFLSNNEVNILEVGFGTGLNALLSAIESQKQNININYVGLELYPVDLEIALNLNYINNLSAGSFKDQFIKMHKSEWEINQLISETFFLKKVNQSIFKYDCPQNTLDLVYYDAFGPRAQREMWDKQIFEKIFSWLKKDGCLVTYCAMGQLKRDLKACGFFVESLPGPPGKREMTRVIKK